MNNINSSRIKYSNNISNTMSRLANIFTRIEYSEGNEIDTFGCLLILSFILDLCFVIDALYRCNENFNNACTVGGHAANYSFIVTMAVYGIIILFGSCVKFWLEEGPDYINFKIISVIQLILSILTIISSLIFLGGLLTYSQGMLSLNSSCGEFITGIFDLWILFRINLIKSLLFVVCFIIIESRICYRRRQYYAF